MTTPVERTGTRRFRKHWPGTETAADVSTQYLKETLTYGQRIADMREIFVLNGKAGLGKTFAAKTLLEQCEKQGLTGYLLDLERGLDSAEVYRRMLQLVSLRKIDGVKRYLRDELAEYLSETPRLFLLDNAYDVGPQALAAVRTLHDRDDANWALAISGVDLGRSLSPDMVSRSMAWINFYRLRGKTLHAYLDAYHPLLANSAPGVLDAIDASLCGGQPRQWAKVLADALPLAHKLKVDLITPKIASAVVHKLKPQTSQRKGRGGDREYGRGTTDVATPTFGSQHQGQRDHPDGDP